MKFRLYQLMLLASLVFTILAMLDPVVSFSESNGAVSVMSNFKYEELATGDVSRSVIALGILLIFTAVVNVLGLFLSFYTNFEMQKRVTILTMLLHAGYYVLFLVYTLLLSDGASMDIKSPMLYPFIALTFNLVSFLMIRRCEAKIIAKALGFRLRD
ncbi:MAG: DUF4293 family protein [Bacteroidaceae bacterium]|nr:DUF4293 family protein [Bacteroidaceae bacterium]